MFYKYKKGIKIQSLIERKTFVFLAKFWDEQENTVDKSRTIRSLIKNVKHIAILSDFII
jgi:hypothetical protein